MSKRTRSSGRRWRFTAGDRGCRVAVFERELGGLLYARTTGARGEDIRVSLGHRDREQAKAYALDQALKLRQGRDDIRAERLYLARLFALYAVHRTPRKTPNEQNEDRRRTTMWTRVLGAQKDAAKITRGEWEKFCRIASQR